MWLFTKYGFFSVVIKAPAPILGASDTTKYVQIRARLKRHLQTLAAEMRIIAHIETGAGTDYRYRVCVSRKVWRRVSCELTACGQVNYPNFKSEVGKREGEADYERALHRVWSVMMQLQTDEGRGVKPKAARPEWYPDGQNFPPTPRASNIASGRMRGY